MDEKCPIKFSHTIATSTLVVGFFYMPQSCNMGPTGFASPPKEGVLRIFSPKKSDGFSRV
jgi:hypothetical protein